MSVTGLFIADILFTGDPAFDKCDSKGVPASLWRLPYDPNDASPKWDGLTIHLVVPPVDAQAGDEVCPSELIFSEPLEGELRDRFIREALPKTLTTIGMVLIRSSKEWINALLE